MTASDLAIWGFIFMLLAIPAGKVTELILVRVFGLKTGPSPNEIGEAIAKSFTDNLVKTTAQAQSGKHGDAVPNETVCTVCRAFLLQRIEGTESWVKTVEEKHEALKEDTGDKFYQILQGFNEFRHELRNELGMRKETNDKGSHRPFGV